MKILMFSYLPPAILSGVATHTHKLSKELQKMGHEIEILSFVNKNGKYDGIKIYPIKSRIDVRDAYVIKTPLALGKINEIIKKSDPDILHLHHRTSSIEFFLDKIETEAPMVNTVHSSTGDLNLSIRDIIHYIHYKKLSEVLQKKSDKVIAVSDYNRKKLIENGLDKEKAVTIRNGIDLKDFNMTKKEARKKLVIDENENIVLFAGRHVKEKGLVYLLKAFKKIEDTKLIVLGEGPLTELYKNLYSKDNIKFLGKVPSEEVPFYFAASDVFIFPSIYQEPQGIVLMEAMASKLPIVASNMGGIPEIIKECKSGILVKPESKEEITKALKKLLGDGELRKKLGENGYKKVKEKYTWDKIAKETEKVYKNVLSSN